MGDRALVCVTVSNLLRVDNLYNHMTVLLWLPRVGVVSTMTVLLWLPRVGVVSTMTVLLWLPRVGLVSTMTVIAMVT